MLVLTFALTVIFDLVVAIEVGILLAAILFMKRMSDVTEVEGWKYLDEEDDPDSIALRAFLTIHWCMKCLPYDSLAQQIRFLKSL